MKGWALAGCFMLLAVLTVPVFATTKIHAEAAVEYALV